MLENLLCEQGGAHVEVFSAQGKDPVGKWKLHGKTNAIRKVFYMFYE